MLRGEGKDWKSKVVKNFQAILFKGDKDKSKVCLVSHLIFAQYARSSVDNNSKKTEKERAVQDGKVGGY